MPPLLRTSTPRTRTLLPCVAPLLPLASLLFAGAAPSSRSFFYGCARCVPGPSPSPAHARPTVASTVAQAAVRSPQPLRPPAPPLQPPSPYLRPLARSHAQGSFCATCTGEEDPPHNLRRADDPPTASRRRPPHHTPSHPLSHHSHTPFHTSPHSQLPPPSPLRASRHPTPLHPRTSLPMDSCLGYGVV